MTAHIDELREALALLGRHVDTLRRLTTVDAVDPDELEVAAFSLGSYAMAVEGMALDLANEAAAA